MQNCRDKLNDNIIGSKLLIEIENPRNAAGTKKAEIVVTLIYAGNINKMTQCSRVKVKLADLRLDKLKWVVNHAIGATLILSASVLGTN